MRRVKEVEEGDEEERKVKELTRERENGSGLGGGRKREVKS